MSSDEVSVGTGVVSLESHHSFDFTSSAYRDLYGRSTATLFQHPVWLRHVYSTLVPATGGEPLIITGHDTADQSLVMVLPLVRYRHAGFRWIAFAGANVAAYNAAVIDPDSEHQIARDQPLHAQLRNILGTTDLLVLDRVHRGADALSAAFGAVPARPELTRLCELNLAPSSNRSQNRISSATDESDGRSELRHPLQPDEIEAALLQLRTFRAASRGRGRDLLADPAVRRFAAQVARDSTPYDGPGLISVVTLDQAPIAVSLGLTNVNQDIHILAGVDGHQPDVAGPAMDQLILDARETFKQSIRVPREIAHDASRDDFTAVTAQSVSKTYSLRGLTARTVRSWRHAMPNNATLHRSRPADSPLTVADVTPG